MAQNTSTYKDAGVDIQKGQEFVDDIGHLVKRTWRSGVMDGLGGFAGFFDLKATGFDDPILLAATDGVGTKVELARQFQKVQGLGVDLVAMCVNDLIVHGGQPLFFLDYLATGKLEHPQHLQIIEGIADGCREAGCALIGGETAEMPGVYDSGKFDLAGFAVGAVERHLKLPRKIAENDIIIGVSSSGFHANGYSLVRKIMQECAIDAHKTLPQSSVRISDALLEPTRIYVQPALDCIDRDLVHGFAHITGGGIIENLPRILPQELSATIDVSQIQTPEVISFLLSHTKIEKTEALRTFNMGIGFCVVCHPDNAGAVCANFSAFDMTASPIGTITQRVNSQPLMLHGL